MFFIFSVTQWHLNLTFDNLNINGFTVYHQLLAIFCDNFLFILHAYPLYNLALFHFKIQYKIPSLFLCTTCLTLSKWQHILYCSGNTSICCSLLLWPSEPTFFYKDIDYKKVSHWTCFLIIIHIW